MSNSNINQKAINAMFHSFLGVFSGNIVNFIVGIILARLLEPSDYGLLGMVTLFVGISGIFVDSGLSLALIREKNVTNEQFSTVFYYNLVVSVIVYFILFFLSTLVSRFFNEPLLIPIIRVVGLGIIIGAFGNIQRTKLTRELNFKTQTKIDVIAAILSSVVGVLLAYLGKGVWALVFMGLFRSIVTTFLLIFSNRWVPLLHFDKESFKRFFNFGYKMLITGLLATLYHNLYNLIIGRTYSKSTLGYYTKSKALNEMVSMSILGTISKVGYPLLSSLQEDKVLFSAGFKKIIKHVSFLSFPVFFGLIAVSDPMINVLFGEKWVQMIPFFRVICLSAIFFPHNALNLNVLQVVGRSDLFLKIDIINMGIGLFMITLSMVFNLGINGLLGTIILLSLISFFTNSYYSKRFINYSTLQQIGGFSKHLTSSFLMGLVAYLTSVVLPFGDLPSLLISVVVGVVVYFILSFVLKVEELWSFTNIILDIIKKTTGKKAL